jgi:cardiolipin synthase
MRIVASEPDRAGLLRLDQLIAAAARETLWISDAYFVGIPSYVEGLRAASLDGVDVRLLVPGGTDIPILRPLSHAGYGPLLQAGIRVFEWNGPMMHAKTAVADGQWARVGSSNLNIASWVGNYELDAVVEDSGFAGSMMEQYLKDLANATEVLLPREQRRYFGRGHRQSRGEAGSAGRVIAAAARVGHTVSAVVTDHRVLQRADVRITAAIGLGLLLIAAAVVRWPLLLAVPAALLLVWIAVALLVRAHRQYRGRQPDAVSFPDVPQPAAPPALSDQKGGWSPGGPPARPGSHRRAALP